MVLHNALERLGFSQEQIKTIMYKDLFLGKRGEIADKEVNRTGTRLDTIPQIGLIRFLYQWEPPEAGGTGTSDIMARKWIETMFRVMKKDEFNLKINFTGPGKHKEKGFEKMSMFLPPKSREDLYEVLKRGPFVYHKPGHAMVAYGLKGNKVLLLDPLGGERKTQPISQFLKSMTQEGIKNHYEIWPVGDTGYEPLPRKLPSQDLIKKFNVTERKS